MNLLIAGDNPKRRRMTKSIVADLADRIDYVLKDKLPEVRRIIQQ